MQPDATHTQPGRALSERETILSRLKENGEPPGTRTPNPQIKSLLLCQLS